MSFAFTCRNKSDSLLSPPVEPIQTTQLTHYILSLVVLHLFFFSASQFCHVSRLFRVRLLLPHSPIMPATLDDRGMDPEYPHAQPEKVEVLAQFK